MTVTARQRGVCRLVSAACGLPAAALLVAGSGPPPDRNAPDGTAVTQDGVDYAIQTPRELNPDDPDGRVFLGGHSTALDVPSDRPFTLRFGTDDRAVSVQLDR